MNDKISFEVPKEFLELCEKIDRTPEEVLSGFIADLCELRGTSEYHGGDESTKAQQYFERAYRFEFPLL